MKTIVHRLFLVDSLFNGPSRHAASDSQDLEQALPNGKIARSIKGISLLIGLIVAVISILFATSCTPAKTEGTEIAMSQEALIKRGKYLMVTSACHDCHSPKIMTPQGPVIDSARLLSGHPKDNPIPKIIMSNDWIMFNNELTAFVGPWGLSFAANLTPHDTGTGSWSFEQFKTAIRKGKFKGLEGSRSLLPPMPWEMYQTFTDDDLMAIFTYLKSIKPIDNLVPYPVAPNDLAALQSK